MPIAGVPKFDTRRVLDGERKIVILKPIPVSSAGRTFEVRGKVLGVYDKGTSGTVVEVEQCLVEVQGDGDGDVYSRAVGSSFFVGQGGWGGPKGESKERLDRMHVFYTTKAIADDAARPQDPNLDPLPQHAPPRNPHDANHARNRASLPPQRRLQPSARDARARREDGLRRAHPPRPLLVERGRARRPARLRRRQAPEPEGVPGQVRGAGQAGGSAGDGDVEGVWGGWGRVGGGPVFG